MFSHQFRPFDGLSAGIAAIQWPHFWPSTLGITPPTARKWLGLSQVSKRQPVLPPLLPLRTSPVGVCLTAIFYPPQGCEHSKINTPDWCTFFVHKTSLHPDQKLFTHTVCINKHDAMRSAADRSDWRHWLDSRSQTSLAPLYDLLNQIRQISRYVGHRR